MCPRFFHGNVIAFPDCSCWGSRDAGDRPLQVPEQVFHDREGFGTACGTKVFAIMGSVAWGIVDPPAISNGTEASAQQENGLYFDAS